MATTPVFTRRRVRSAEHPVELRFIDMLLIIIATLMFVAVVLSMTSAFTAARSNGEPTLSPRVATASVPSAITGEPYNLTLAAEGGDGIYSWRLLRGRLPAHLTLNRDGTLRGTPTRREADLQATVEVTDSSGYSAQQDLVFNVRPAGQGSVTPVAPEIVAPEILLTPMAGRNYQYTFAAAAGTPPYSWSGSQLPNGLQLAPDGTLTGQPAQAGSSTFTVSMRDSSGATAQQKVRMMVTSPPPPFLGRITSWAKTIATFAGYLLILALIWSWMKPQIFGSKGKIIRVDPKPSLRQRLKGSE